MIFFCSGSTTPFNLCKEQITPVNTTQIEPEILFLNTAATLFASSSAIKPYPPKKLYRFFQWLYRQDGHHAAVHSAA